MGETSFKLPQEKLIVKYIKRRKGLASGQHIGEDHVISGGMLTNATKRFTAPLRRNGSLANVLTNDEKDHLESLTGLNLSIYGDFWVDHYVTLRKESNQFDLSNPMDYISVAILKSLKDLIAPNWASRNNKQSYEFVIVEDGAEFKEDKRKYDTKKDAFKLYGKIEDDKEHLLGILKLLTNRAISDNSTLEWIQGKVEEVIDNDPSKFVGVVKDSALATKLLINKGVNAGVINKTSNKYITADGLPLCSVDENPTFDKAVKYLDNPKNQEVRSLIEAKINNAE